MDEQPQGAAPAAAAPITSTAQTLLDRQLAVLMSLQATSTKLSRSLEGVRGRGPAGPAPAPPEVESVAGMLPVLERLTAAQESVAPALAAQADELVALFGTPRTPAGR